MTTQFSFKRRVRARMERTGERYVVARAALLAQATAASNETRTWVSMPEMSDEAVRKATGRGWNDWCDLIDAWPGHTDGHAAIAKYLDAAYEIGGWWAQSVTVGYERITGIRLPGQRPDGTFTVSKSKTVTADAGLLRDALLDDASRADLFPDQESQLRSKPASKAIRLGIGGGIAVLSVEPMKDGRSKVFIEHTKLPSPDVADEWRFYWGEWLDALDDA